jgi:very-short-patch-repair endonuclease
MQDTLKARPGSADQVITALAAVQHGVVARWQLLEAWVPAHVIRHRLNTQRLRVRHVGVYQVGPLAAPCSLEMAAVLACGDAAVLSHRSAGRLWQIVRAAPSASAEVIVPVTQRCRRPGIRVYRLGPLQHNEVTRHDGIPVTTPARTLLDLARVLTHNELERTLAEALALKLTSRRELKRLLGRHAAAPGAAGLAGLIERPNAPALTLSVAEERLRELVDKAGISQPETNVWVHGHCVDLLWPNERFIVEVDGYAFHSSRNRFEQDRRRDAELAAAGYHVVRVTWQQLTQEPEATLVRLALALDRARRV